MGGTVGNHREGASLFPGAPPPRVADAERVLRKAGQVYLRRRWQPPSSSFQLKSCCPAALLDKSADPGSSLLEFDELCRRVCLLLEFLYANRSQHADDRALGPIHGHAFVFQLGCASSNRLQHTFRQVTGCKRICRFRGKTRTNEAIAATTATTRQAPSHSRAWRQSSSLLVKG